jgi:hypothetical protein
MLDRPGTDNRGDYTGSVCDPTQGDLRWRHCLTPISSPLAGTFSFLSPDDFIFANAVGGLLDTDNYRKRVLHKLARDLNLPELTFQVIRRTIATLAQKKGTVKDVQGVLRHSRTATTTDVYMQEIPESVQATVNSIHSELRPRSPSRTAKVWTAERRAEASVKSNERLAAKKSPLLRGRKRTQLCSGS